MVKKEVKIGRPISKNPKSLVTSVRMTKETKELIIDGYESVQAFFDHMVKIEKEVISETK